MKNVMMTAVGVALLLMAAQVGYAQMDMVAKMDIAAIRSMQFVQEGGKFYCDCEIVFVNKGENEGKLRSADFKVSFKTPTGVLLIGSGKVDELILPAATADAPGSASKKMRIAMGPKNDETMQRLIEIFNVLGNPTTEFTLLLEGTSEVGMRTDKGWVYQKGISVELEFTPTIQREVLFN